MWLHFAPKVTAGIQTGAPDLSGGRSLDYMTTLYSLHLAWELLTKSLPFKVQDFIGQRGQHRPAVGVIASRFEVTRVPIQDYVLGSQTF